MCADTDGSCADGTFDARYGYDLDGNRLWARLHDGQSETVVVQIEGLADWTRGSNDAQIHVVAFGRRVATKYLESAVALAAPSYVPGTKVPLEPGWLLFAVAFAGGLWLLVIAVRDGVPSRMAERPVSATVVILISGLLIAPPPAWAGGGGGGGGTQVYRRWLFHDHLGTNVLVTNVNGAVIRRRLFEPFGKLLNQQSSTEPHDRLFTGQRYEESTELYDFQQRWYDAETGRFTGVDPLVQRPADPQTINPYGYVRNNPTANVDPDGRLAVGLAGLSVAIALNLAGAIGAAAPPPPPPPEPRKTAKELTLGDGTITGSNIAGNPALEKIFADAGIDPHGFSTASTSPLGSQSIDTGALQPPNGSIAQAFANNNEILRAQMAVALIEAGIAPTPAWSGANVALHRGFSVVASGVLIDAGAEIVGGALLGVGGLAEIGVLGTAAGLGAAVLLLFGATLIGTGMIAVGVENLIFQAFGAKPISGFTGLDLPIFSPPPGVTGSRFLPGGRGRQ